MIIEQSEFRAAILDPTRNHPEGLQDGVGRAAGRRFDVYRNNVAASLSEALETAFPVVAKLLGQQNFKVLAGVFLRHHPPLSPLMMFYGGEMPAFLRTFEPTSNIGYLPDVARLELALRESYHAADTNAIDPARLQEMNPEELLRTNVGLAPSLRLVRSEWPIHSVWRFNIEQGAPKPTMRAEDVVVLRDNLDPAPHLLPSGGGAFLAALQDGLALGEAVELATDETTDFDLSATLTLLIGSGAIISLGD